MGTFKEIDGDLIKLAKEGEFDVIAHGCNCFCTMGAGIAPQMAKAFGADKFNLENPVYKGDINKLGNIDWCKMWLPTPTPIGVNFGGFELVIVNAYTQYNYGANHADGDSKPVDYDAITLVMRKINYLFKGKHIGLPKIGSGLAGGDWEIIRDILYHELKDCTVTIVNYKP